MNFNALPALLASHRSLERTAIKRKRSHLSLATLPTVRRGKNLRDHRSSSFLPFFAPSRSCVKTATRKKTVEKRPQLFFFLPSTSNVGTHSFEMVRSRARGRKKESGGGEHACAPGFAQSLYYISLINNESRDTSAICCRNWIRRAV